LGDLSRDGIATGAFSHRQSGQLARVKVPSLTDQGPTGIAPAIDSSGLPTASRLSSCGEPPSIRGAWGRRAWTKHVRAAQFNYGRPTPSSSATNRHCRLTVGRVDLSIAAASRYNGLPGGLYPPSAALLSCTAPFSHPSPTPPTFP